MAVHVETIGLQKDSVRIALKSMLQRIDKDMCVIELLLVPVLTYLTYDNMASRLK